MWISGILGRRLHHNLCSSRVQAPGAPILSLVHMRIRCTNDSGQRDRPGELKGAIGIPTLHTTCGRLLCMYWVTLFVATHIPLPPAALPAGSDKVVHFVTYCPLAILLTLYLRLKNRGRGAAVRTACLVLTVWIILDELLQIPVPGRFADFDDGVADAAGSITGALLAATLPLSRWPRAGS